MGARVMLLSRPKTARWCRFWAEWREDVLATFFFCLTIAVVLIVVAALPADAQETSVEIIDATSSSVPLYPAPSVTTDVMTLEIAPGAVSWPLAETGGGNLVLLLVVGGALVISGLVLWLGSGRGGVRHG